MTKYLICTDGHLYQLFNTETETFDYKGLTLEEAEILKNI